MNLHIYIQMIIYSFYLVVYSAPAVDAETIAKPGCISTCGGVNISYPFGIEKGCYHDEWYEITCNNISNKPFLSKFNMEVLKVNIQVNFQQGENSIMLMNPVASNCQRQNRNANFSGSPFSFSKSQNKFTVVGCGNAQVLNSTNATIAGCTSSCKTYTGDRVCNGINCCQASLWANPSDLSFYTISFEENATINCTYAFLMSDYYYNDQNSPLSFINNTKQAPVQINWDFNIAGNKNCYNYPFGSSGRDYSCSCKFDHVGNPYIPDGCTIHPACARCEHDCNRSDTDEFYCNNPYKTERIVGATFGGLLVVLICSFCIWLSKFIKKRRIMNQKKMFFKRNGGLLLEQQLSSNDGKIEKTIVFTSDELKKATDNYNEDRILGQGGQGTVYKGMLTDGKITAVKKSKVIDESQLEQFINEVVILSQINHRNIVQLLGCCLETEVPLLVYEFVPNGNLSELICDESEEFLLSWKMRLQIATEVAGALTYLHSASSTPIYHRDVKSTNILLDEKFRAKVSDFGTSRTITIEQTHLTTLVYGTFGYLDPEYFQSSQFTDKSDVYSFGVVLVELLTGQKPISSVQSEEERSLATRFVLYMEQMRVLDIVDSRVLEEAPKEKIIAVAEIARRCLKLNGKKRPTMKEVATDLEVISRAPSTHTPISLNQDTAFDIENKNNDHDHYSTFTMLASDYRAFTSTAEPQAFYTE